MTADRLRRVATVLRERAEAATPGPWVATKYGLTRPVGSDVEAADGRGVATECCGYQGACGDVNAEYIATMHPGVALALADWLDYRARFCASEGVPADLHDLRVADLILGADS